MIRLRASRNEKMANPPAGGALSREVLHKQHAHCDRSLEIVRQSREIPSFHREQALLVRAGAAFEGLARRGDSPISTRTDASGTPPYVGSRSGSVADPLQGFQ